MFHGACLFSTIESAGAVAGSNRPERWEEEAAGSPGSVFDSQPVAGSSPAGPPPDSLLMTDNLPGRIRMHIRAQSKL